MPTGPPSRPSWHPGPGWWRPCWRARFPRTWSRCSAPPAHHCCLLPLRWSDLRASCTCPDSANPCKHLAAVLYVFADQLDTDPWLLLQWRGRSRDEVIDLLRSDQPSAETVAPWWPFGPGPLPDEALTAPLQPGGRTLPVNGDAAAVLDVLRPTELEIRNTPVVDIIRGAYRAVIATDDSQ